MSLHQPEVVEQVRRSVLFCSCFVSAALLREVNIVQVSDTITCSSERIYPEPTLSWSGNLPVALNTDVQVTEDGLFSISSAINVSSSANESYSCTVSAGSSKRKTTLFPSRRPVLPFPENPLTRRRFKRVLCFILGHLRSQLHIRPRNNDILLRPERDSDPAHLEIQPHTDHPDWHRDEWHLHAVRQLETTGEGRVPVRGPPLTRSVSVSGRDVHLRDQQPRGNTRNRHEGEIQEKSR